MKPLAVSNRWLQAPESRSTAVVRNVRSSSAIEGVSIQVFERAANGRFINKAKSVSRTGVIKAPRPKK